MKTLIRTAHIDDCEMIAALSIQLGYTADAERTRIRISEVLKSDDNAAFVAIENGYVVGWVHAFYTLRIESDAFVEIGGLVIDVNHRQRGIGNALVQRVMEWATHKHVSTVRVRCNTIRNESHQFYKHIGFEEVKEQKVFSIALK